MAKKKMDLEAFNSYIHSEAFITDFGIRHTAKDSFSWLIYTPKQGKHIVWMNGYPKNVAYVTEYFGDSLALASSIVEDGRIDARCLHSVALKPVFDGNNRRYVNDSINEIIDMVEALPVIRKCGPYKKDFIPF